MRYVSVLALYIIVGGLSHLCANLDKPLTPTLVSFTVSSWWPCAGSSDRAIGRPSSRSSRPWTLTWATRSVRRRTSTTSRITSTRRRWATERTTRWRTTPRRRWRGRRTASAHPWRRRCSTTVIARMAGVLARTCCRTWTIRTIASPAGVASPGGRCSTVVTVHRRHAYMTIRASVCRWQDLVVVRHGLVGLVITGRHRSNRRIGITTGAMRTVQYIQSATRRIVTRVGQMMLAVASETASRMDTSQWRIFRQARIGSECWRVMFVDQCHYHRTRPNWSCCHLPCRCIEVGRDRFTRVCSYVIRVSWSLSTCHSNCGLAVRRETCRVVAVSTSEIALNRDEPTPKENVS